MLDIADIDTPAVTKALHGDQVPLTNHTSSPSFGDLVDLDVDKLEGVVDECHRRVKHDIVGYMLTYKARASAQHSAAVEHERLKAADAISAKQGEVELLKKELSDAAKQAKASSIVSTRLADAFGRAKGGVAAAYFRRYPSASGSPARMLAEQCLVQRSVPLPEPEAGSEAAEYLPFELDPCPTNTGMGCF